MKRATARERRHLKTKQAILDAARQIIAKKGTDALSMRQLAQAIDYSPAALYEYFGSKDEILAAVTAEGHARLQAAMEQADGSLSTQERLIALGLAYIRFARTHPEHYLLMFAGAPMQVTLDEASSFTPLLETIQRGVAQDELHERPNFGVLEMAYAAWALVHGISMLRLNCLREMAAIDLDVADRELLVNFWRGLEAS
ncbi:MAG: TetR/AcrR family transcriptional regulator [Anaerolineales bacterium]|nr:TetR/AcrR family transcriptional regulator [Anaerolineales bacterium]